MLEFKMSTPILILIMVGLLGLVGIGVFIYLLCKETAEFFALLEEESNGPADIVFEEDENDHWGLTDTEVLGLCDEFEIFIDHEIFIDQKKK